MFSRFNRLRQYVKEHERHISVGALLFGFVWDSITIGRADQIFGNVVIVSYLTLNAGIILLLSLYEKRAEEYPVFLPALMQFSFGNLAGGLLVIYGQSGSIDGSLLFFIILLAFILGNELARNLYSKFIFYISAWYFLLFAYLAVVVPVFVGRLGALVFILSGILSLVLVFTFLRLAQYIYPQKIVSQKKNSALAIGLIFITFNGLYFKNIIPPVPLSLTEIGIYHYVERAEAGGDYFVTYEKPRWLSGFFRDTSAVFKTGSGSTAYCFSSIYAPVHLSTRVYHLWQYYDEGSGDWQTTTQISFPIAGGRSDGYRGYSVKENITAGEWRCSVETGRGAIIGRTEFEVSSGIPNLSSKTF